MAESEYYILQDTLLEEVHKTLLESLFVQQTCASLQNVATCQLVIPTESRAQYIPTESRQPVFINGIKQVSSLTL